MPKGWVPLSCAEDLITLVLTEIEGKYPSSEKVSRLFSFLKAKGSQERPQEPPPSRLVFLRSSGTFAVQLEKDALVVERSGIRRDADLVRQFRAQIGLKRPYPEPVLETDLTPPEVLKEILPLREDQALVCAIWAMTAALSSVESVPVLLLEGPPGSGKTTLARVLATLIDPEPALLCRLGHDTRDLTAALSYNLVVVLDNLEKIPTSFATTLASTITGGFVVERKLKTNRALEVYGHRCRVIITGISPALPSDLVDRCIILSLEPLRTMRRWTRRRSTRRAVEAPPRLAG
ncbi:MAG: hypothetical protein Q9N34_06865 [Aquificota bacterium]|nr:hypothetical protein [Aquificota bacterium]